MTISPELFMSILSMDSYNRGYNPGVTGLNSAEIGNATAIDQTVFGIGEPEYFEWQAAGFYAVAYQWNGETVISYRGTDTLIDWTNLDPWSDTPCGDFCNAYLTGLGSSATAQAQRRRCLPGSMP